MTLFADAIYALPINLIIWSICIGANLGFLYSYFSKNVIGEVVRRLISNGATSEERALSLSELGYDRFSFFHKIMLKDSSNVRRIVFVLGNQIPKAMNEEGVLAPDWQSAKFYVPESTMKKATAAYGTAQKWFYIPIFVVSSTILSAIMTVIMPMLVEALPLI